MKTDRKPSPIAGPVPGDEPVAGGVPRHARDPQHVPPTPGGPSSVPLNRPISEDENAPAPISPAPRPLISARLRSLRSDHLAARLAVAVAIIVLALFTNRTFLGWGLFATLAILFVPLGRARSFIVSFIPYAVVWFLFGFIRSFADETILARTLNTDVPRLERWLFSGQLPSIRLQERFFDPTHLRWYDYLLTGTHWSYFIIPHVVAVRLWQKDPVLFRRYFSALTILLGVGLCIYFLIPSNPPWLAPDPVNTPAAVQVARVMEPVGKALGGGLYNASYRVIGESNPIAAMPSIHMAVTFLLVFVARPAGRRWRWLALAYAALMGFALVYLGEHYVVDVAVGMLIAAYGWFAAGVWLSGVAPVLRQRFAQATPSSHSPRGAGV